MAKFPCLRLAREAGVAGGLAPCVLNAANEVAVAAFLDGRVRFTDIARACADALERPGPAQVESIEAALEIDAAARERARAFLGLGARRAQSAVSA